MIKPKQMSRVSVFGPKSYLKSVIETLYDSNAVHIQDHTKKSEDEFFDIGEPLPANEKYADLLVKVRALVANLGIQKKDVAPSTTSFDIVEKKVQKLHEEINSILDRKEYYGKIKKAYDKKSVEKALLSVRVMTDEDKDYSSYIYYIGFADSEYEALRDAIDKITKKYVLHCSNFDGITVISLLVDKSKKEKAESVLESISFSPIDVPLIKKNLPDLKIKPGQKFLKLDHESEIMQRKMLEIDTDLKKIKIEHGDFFLSTEKMLRIETDKAEAPLKFATTKNTFLIKGWVPTENSKKLEDGLNKATGGRVMVTLKKASRNENAPIAFNHPKIVEPFEAFMDLYTLPTYKEIDPTFFMFLTFPLFFGMMLGDVGYGLVCFLLFSFLKAKMPGAKNMLNAFIIASLSSILFGVIFGEYFGYEEVSPALGHMLGIHPETVVMHGETEVIYPIWHLFSRSHGINDLLSIAVLFGIAHLFIGYIIGFINIYKAHGLKHAVMEKVGWMLLFPAVIYLLTDFLGVVTGFVREMLMPLVPPMPYMIGLSVIGILVIILGEGARGAVEIPALISNILSYARLMAVGLASLSLALVINDMAGGMFASGPVGIVGGILILVIGHTINIALGILSPFLHSLRLHYVEFFTKFFQGGGKKFKSFGYTNQ